MFSRKERSNKEGCYTLCYDGGFCPLGQDTPCGKHVGILRRWENGWWDGIMIWWTTSGEEMNFLVTSINGSNLIYPPMSGYDEAIKSLALLAVSWWKQQHQSLKSRFKKHFVTRKEATAEALRIQVSSRGRSGRRRTGNKRNTKVFFERKGQQRHSEKKLNEWKALDSGLNHEWERLPVDFDFCASDSIQNIPNLIFVLQKLKWIKPKSLNSTIFELVSLKQTYI